MHSLAGKNSNSMTDSVERAFLRMGARVKFEQLVPDRGGARGIGLQDLALDVRRDSRGEYFRARLEAMSSTELLALDVQAEQRHLLLLSRKGREKHRFLMGYDERHWFVAAIPESSPVSTVRDAKRALKPQEVLDSERDLCSWDVDRRTSRARVRQGEWFFVPRFDVKVRPLLILRNEPLLRTGGSKPHLCEELYRFGGENVYVSRNRNTVLTETEYQALAERRFSGYQRNQDGWRVMRRNMRVLARGRVRHPDHATAMLNGWHEVFSNTEHLSEARRNVVFLD